MEFAERIDGERLFLQAPKADFATAEKYLKLALHSLEDLKPWLLWANYPLSAESYYDFLKNAEKERKESCGVYYMICRRDDGLFIGDISLHDIDCKNFSGKFGYWIGSAYAGQGYMREAVRLLEQDLFRRGFNRLVIETDVRNLKSAAVAQACSYHKEGIMRQKEYNPLQKEYRDINLFAKLRQEFTND